MTRIESAAREFLAQCGIWPEIAERILPHVLALVHQAKSAQVIDISPPINTPVPLPRLQANANFGNT